MQSEVTATSGTQPAPATPPGTTRFGAGCLVLTDRPDDIAGLLPPRLTVRFEADPATYRGVLRGAHVPVLAVLVAPPAGIDDIREAATQRDGHPDMRVVLLSPPEAVAQRLHALELGFDDAIDLGAQAVEIAGRLAIAARSRPVTTRALVAPGTVLDVAARTLSRGGEPVPLRKREFELLSFFAAHPGQAFSREDLRRMALPADAKESPTAINVHVFNLRAKIEPDPARPRYLVTVPMVGYRFDPPT
jgi:DNA-binding response OmpR family regulator